MNSQILHGEALEVLKTLKDESIDCVVTSPPYWGLRDYGTAEWVDGNDPLCDHKIHQNSIDPKNPNCPGSHTVQINRKKCFKCGATRVDSQLGLEETFNEYIERLCDIFDEVKRVLKKTGVCFVNIGDTYMGDSSYSLKGRQGFEKKDGVIKKDKSQCQRKSLCQIPSRFAIEMTNRGWILRNELIWRKPNVMPSPVKDRFVVDFEKVFFFTKNQYYFFETQYEPYLNEINRWGGDKITPTSESEWDKGTGQETYRDRDMRPNKEGRTKRCVWDVNTKPLKESHFASYPKKLIEPMIKAGCPEFVCSKCGQPKEKIKEKVGEFQRRWGTENAEDSPYKQQGSTQNIYKEVGLTDCECGCEFKSGIVLDPFFGAGTTGIVALEQGKNYIGIELNEDYIKIADDRIKKSIKDEKINFLKKEENVKKSLFF